jgi:hypothetical protein
MSPLRAFGHGRDGNRSGHNYKDVNIGEGAKAHLGDAYYFRAHTFGAYLETKH